MTIPQAHIEWITVLGEEQFDLDWEDRVLSVKGETAYPEGGGPDVEVEWTVTILRRG